jgi:uncharacterized protein YbjT (DUF2867 family)
MKALIIGASGLVGSALLEQLLADDNISKVTVVLRRPLAIDHPKLTTVLFDFQNYPSTFSMDADAVFCCVGTTIKKAGNQANFRKVDYDIPVYFGKQSAENTIQTFCLVSSMGADAHSAVFYNKVKGEVEDYIATQNISKIGIFRPSLLLGDRNEYRFGEKFATIAMKTFDFLIPKKYKAIHVSEVAKAMIVFAKKLQPGKLVFESDQISNNSL